MSDKVAIYTRVSTDEQKTSLGVQAERCKRYCEFAGLTVSWHWSDAGVSGGVHVCERPAGQRLCNGIRDGRVEHVIVLKVDRLFRDVADALATVEEWNKRGVALHVVDLGGQAINTGTAAGWMCFLQLVAMAEFERRIISERTTAALQHRKANGKVYTGQAAYGWDHVNGERVRNEHEQAIIEVMQFEREEGSTLQQIADLINARQYPTKRGGRWTAGQVGRVLKREG